MHSGPHPGGEQPACHASTSDHTVPLGNSPGEALGEGGDPEADTMRRSLLGPSQVVQGECQIAVGF